MDKKQFLHELEKNLHGMPREDAKEILGDYEEHFVVGKKKGRKEWEIAKSLGNPKEIAEEAKRELGGKEDFAEDIKKVGRIIGSTASNFWIALKTGFNKDYPRAKNKIKERDKELKEKIEKPKRKNSFWAIFGLFWLNFLLVIWIFLSLYIISFSLYISGIAIGISAIAGFFGALFILISPSSTMLNYLAASALFGTGGLFLLSILWIKGTSLITKGISRLLNKYYKWNRRVMRK